MNQGKAACANWSCTPSVTSCSTDQLRVEKCGADGETKTVDHECDPGQVCLSGACVAETCTPSQKFCRAGNVAQCSADGRTSTVAATCDSGSHCDDTALACVPNVCTPGSDTCQGNQTAHCKGDGTGFENQQDCGTSSVCVAGSCRAVACDPNEELCVGNTIQQCSADGSTQSVVQTCGEGTVCVAAAGSAPSCVADSCVAGQTQCDGNTVTQCNTAGNAFEPLTDCTATGGVCYAGQCQPKVCTSGTLSCSQGNVEVCVHNGASNALFRACNSAEFCDSSSPGCKPLVCTPNAPGCNGKFAATCNADGSGFASAGAVDCSLSGQVCDGGACKAVSCTPGAMFCQSQDVYVCNALGTAGNLSADCSNGYTHCAQSGSVAFCTYNVCSAGVATCRGNVATKCNADSSGYDTGTDCGAQACVNGACQPKICTPGALSCVSGNSQVCNATGTGTTLNQSCAASQYCSASSGSCVPDVCAAAAQGCVGEVLGLCSSDGGSVSATGSTNCKASNQLCTFAGCAATASDAISSSAQNGLNPSSQTMYGAVVYVSTARTLTGIQEYFGISSSSTMRWVVYASDTQSGPYTPIFDLLASATSIGDAEQSSPTLSVPLSAGKYYYFGAVVPGPTFFSYELTTAQRFTSFGHALGAYQATGSPPSSFTFTPNSNYPTLTLSTTLP